MRTILPTIALCLLSFSSASAQTANYFMRYERGTPTTELLKANVGSFEGVTAGLTKHLKSSPFQLGASITGMHLYHEDWKAPFSSADISLPDADHCRNAFLVQSDIFVRYEMPVRSKRLIPYGEVGTAASYVSTAVDITTPNPDDECHPTFLDRQPLSKDFFVSASAGAGVLLKLCTLKCWCEKTGDVLYLDFYGGGRKALGEMTFFQRGDNAEFTAPLDYLTLRVGLNIRFDWSEDRCPVSRE